MKGRCVVKPLLNVRHLSIGYPADSFGERYNRVVAVQDVAFHIQAGELLAIVGTSGAGKSSICGALMGVDGMHVQGQLWFEGTDLLRLSAQERRALRGRHIAWLPQSGQALNPMMTVGGHITETLRTHLPVSRRDARSMALNLLQTFELPEARRVMKAFPYQISGGMARRALMAIAFACGPRLVLADEPTRGLDTDKRDALLCTLRRIARERGTALLLVTHDLEVAAVCDRVAVLHQGRIVETGCSRVVLTCPTHGRAQALVQARSAAMTPLRRQCRIPATGGLHVSGLSKNWPGTDGRPRPVLQQVTFEMAPGEIFGLTGPSGAGKTTLARILLGLETAAAGTATLNGHNLFSLRGRAWRAFRRQIQAITQQPESALNPRQTIRKSLQEVLRLARVNRQGRSESINPNTPADMLASVALTPNHLERWPHQLSGGELQRVVIARVMALHPCLIIADEPTASLDTVTQADIMRLILARCRAIGAAMLLISHNRCMIQAVCDRVQELPLLNCE